MVDRYVVQDNTHASLLQLRDKGLVGLQALQHQRDRLQVGLACWACSRGRVAVWTGRQWDCSCCGGVGTRCSGPRASLPVADFSVAPCNQFPSEASCLS